MARPLLLCSRQMTESAVLLIPLGVLSVCACVLTGVAIVTARRMRRTMERIDDTLPSCKLAMHQARQTLKETHQLLVQTQATANRVTAVVDAACEVASATMNELVGFKKRTAVLLSGFRGNGARGGPRRHAKRHHG